MNRYNVRIDGEIMPKSYTYKELLLNDILDFDDIEIKQVTKSNWTKIKSFYFPEEHEEGLSEVPEFYIDENGQAQFKENNKKETQALSKQEYIIDEFGQVVSQNNIGGGLSTGSENLSVSSGSSDNNASSDDNVGWKILLTIVFVVLFIIITCTTGWGTFPAGIVGYLLLKNIWSDNI